MTKRNSSGKESVIRVLKANPGKRMSKREVHDYMLCKGYKMCDPSTVAAAFKSLKKDGFVEIYDTDGQVHVTAKKGTQHSRRSMYATWIAPIEQDETTPITTKKNKHIPMHKSLAAAQDDVDIEELCDNAPGHVTRALLWLKLHDYDILLVKK